MSDWLIDRVLHTIAAAAAAVAAAARINDCAAGRGVGLGDRAKESNRLVLAGTDR